MLEIIEDDDLFEGATVIPLNQVSDDLTYFVCDYVEERSFFMEEKFASFDFNGWFSEDGKCEMNLNSIVPFGEGYAWSLLCAQDVDMVVVSPNISRMINGNLFSQNYSFSLREGVEHGYFQTICLASQLNYGGEQYKRFSVIDFHVYKNRKIRETLPFPVIRSYRPFMIEAYFPVHIGEHLQITSLFDEIHSDKTDISNLCRCFKMGEESFFSKTFVYYEGGVINVGKKKVHLCKIESRDDKNYGIVPLPSGPAVVHTEGLDGIEIIGDFKLAFDSPAAKTTPIAGGLRFDFSSSIYGLATQNSEGYLWIHYRKD